MSKFVNGIGTNEGKCLAVKDGKPTKEYRAWRDMLFRCTEKCWIKSPSYIGQLVQKTLRVTPSSTNGVKHRLALVIKTKKIKYGLLMKIFS